MVKKLVVHGDSRVRLTSPTLRIRKNAIRLSNVLAQVADYNPTEKNNPVDRKVAELQMLFLAIITCVESQQGLPFGLPTLNDKPERMKVAWEHFLDDDTGLWKALEQGAQEVGALAIWGK